MKKMLLLLFATVPIMLGVLTYSQKNASNDCDCLVDESSVVVKKQKGLTLDVARRYYPVESIKKYIDLLSANNYNYLQLHFSDDQNYGIESSILGQTESTATKYNGIYTNKKTGKNFLSKKQVKDIVQYASNKGIEVIPEIQVVGHMQGISDLVTLKNPEQANKLFPNVSNEIDYLTAENVEFSLELLTEVINNFDNVQRVHLGGDEFSYDDKRINNYAKYVNTMTTYVESKGLTTMIWNDGVKKSNVDAFDKDIEITYWAYSNWDGSMNDNNDKATMQEVIDNNLKVYNYNGYYNYFVPSERAMTEESISYRERDFLENWDYGKWDLNTGKTLENSDKVKGASLSIWGENSKSYLDEEIYSAIKQQIEDFGVNK